MGVLPDLLKGNESGVGVTNENVIVVFHDNISDGDIIVGHVCALVGGTLLLEDDCGWRGIKSIIFQPHFRKHIEFKRVDAIGFSFFFGVLAVTCM